VQTYAEMAMKREHNWLGHFTVCECVRTRLGWW